MLIFIGTCYGLWKTYYNLDELIIGVEIEKKYNRLVVNLFFNFEFEIYSPPVERDLIIILHLAINYNFHELLY